jgi:hypothetical protein
VPETERQVASGYSIAGADLPEVRVVDQETEQAQEDRR